MNQKYNGWTNYGTWLMGLVLSNEQNLYNSVLEQIKENEDESTYDKADILKEWIEENFYVEEYSIYRVDCESWTLRDFKEINFFEIIENFEKK